MDKGTYVVEALEDGQRSVVGAFGDREQAELMEGYTGVTSLTPLPIRIVEHANA